MPPPFAPGQGWRRWGRRLLWIVAAALLLSALAWLGVPPLLRWQGQKIGSEQLGRAVHIGNVKFNPWTLELTVDNVSVAGEGAEPAQFSVERLYVDAAWQSIVRLAPVVDAFQVDAPVLRLTHRGAGHYDVDDILARLRAGPKSQDDGKPARFAFYNIDLRGGRVEFNDEPAQQEHELADLHLTVPFISSLPSAREIRVQPELAFTLNGSHFDSSAQALPFDASRRTDAVLRLAGLELKPYLAYLPAQGPLRPQAGTVDAELRLRFEETPTQSLRIDGKLTLRGLAAVDAQGAEALSLDTLRVQLAELRPLEARAHLAAVELDHPRLQVRRDAQGRLNLMPSEAADAGEEGARPQPVPKTEPASAASASAPAPAAPAPRLALRIDQLTLRGGELDFRDDSTQGEHAGAAALRMQGLDVTARSIALPQEEPLSFSGSASLEGAQGSAPTAPAPAGDAHKPDGKVQAQEADAGPSGAAPRATLAFEGSASEREAEVKARLGGLSLALARPYLAPYLAGRLDGTVQAQVGARWAAASSPDAQPDLELRVEQLDLDHLVLTGEAAPAAQPGRRTRAAGAADATVASVDRLGIAGARIDPGARSVSIDAITIEGPRLTAERAADGRWMVQQWLREPASTANGQSTGAHDSTGESPAWTAQLDALALRGGRVGFTDRHVMPPVQAEVDQLQLDARGASLDGRQPIPVELSARVASGRRTVGQPGRVAWRGELALEPLAARGDVEVERLPVHAFAPYFDEDLNIDIARADASYKGHVAYAQTEHGPRLLAKGDARVEDLRTYSRPGTAAGAAEASGTPSARAGRPQAARTPAAPRAGGVLGDELVNWKQLRVQGLDVRVEPGQAPKVSVAGTRLSDFFARIVLHENGRFNLQDILKGRGTEAVAAAAPATAQPGQPAAGEHSAGDADTAPASAAPAAASTAAKPVDPLAPVLQLGPTELVNGRIDFSDHFIRPNYSADLTQLRGTLGAFASVKSGGPPQMADLQLAGRAEGSATLDVSGQINPLADPLALDLRAKVTDLDLPPLSPYAVKYSGHGIERGKLSMDVAYKIAPDGQLTATNNVVLNQLQFGEPVAGAPASLPVQLATALLADSNGVIDLDLPISGSINDPQFSLGPIIFKAVVGLIGKAITAPFTLLARALGGGGEDLSSVAFAPGSAQLDAKARAQLDKVAKALADRPQLKLTVVGTADLDEEREGYRRARLHALVAAEQRGEEPNLSQAPAGSKTSASGPAAAAPAAAASQAAEGGDTVSQAHYPELLRRLYRRADIPDKPRNVIGMQRDIPVPEMEALLMAQIPVDKDTMRQLAIRRGEAVKDYLAGHGAPAARLFLGSARLGRAPAATEASAAAAPADAASSAKAAWTPHAELSLGM